MSTNITGKPFTPLTLEEAQAFWQTEHPAHRKVYEGHRVKWLMLAGFPHVVRTDGRHATYFYYLSNGEPIAVRLWQPDAQAEYERLYSKQRTLF